MMLAVRVSEEVVPCCGPHLTCMVLELIEGIKGMRVPGPIYERAQENQPLRHINATAKTLRAFLLIRCLRLAEGQYILDSGPSRSSLNFDLSPTRHTHCRPTATLS